MMELREEIPFHVQGWCMTLKNKQSQNVSMDKELSFLKIKTKGDIKMGERVLGDKVSVQFINKTFTVDLTEQFNSILI